VWGPREQNDLEAMKELIRPFFPPRPSDAPAEPDYSEPGTLERLATQAGLKPARSFDKRWAYVFEDAETLGRAMLAPAGIAQLVGPEGEQDMRDAIVQGLARFRMPDGTYRPTNQFHYLLARAG
jgi:hypothetical protein